MLPAIIVLASISLYPFFWLIYMSLHEVQLAPNRPDVWVGLANFARLLTDRKFINGWRLLVEYSAMCLVLQVGLGMLLPLILHNSLLAQLLGTSFTIPPI